jgi:RNA polymerase sigma-70 factor (ECF subfamily)
MVRPGPGVYFIEGTLKAIVMGEGPRQLSQQLERIFDQHYALIYRTAYSLTGSGADAEDIVQTIFLRLLNRDLPLDLGSAPERYLYRAAFNLSLNTIRDKKRQVLTSDMKAFDTAYGPGEASSEDVTMDRALHDAIAVLHPAAAQIVILRYVHDYSLADIARMLGTTRGTVAVSLFRSRARLRKCLSEARKGGHHAI